ncbi:hypothetical protein GALMADRAFT_720853 [Galerina marginata CBS 339.88]|uniref:Uncharacterized protein n=1 Tax=Galerina marginata (strain CBS 339.88) TaxID=685588 RepID=A0A067TXH6_GALM3|nr:hypothetical protein GALMADRAFT_720853 [Galerina marginata CBS 339.88]
MISDFYLNHQGRQTVESTSYPRLAITKCSVASRRKSECTKPVELREPEGVLVVANFALCSTSCSQPLRSSSQCGRQPFIKRLVGGGS